MKAWIKRVEWIVLIATISFLSYQLFNSKQTIKHSEQLAAFSLPRVDQQLQFKSNYIYTGQSSKFILINFWASWCKVCETEFEYFGQLQNDFPLQLEILRVATSDNLDAIKRSGKISKITGDVLLDVEGTLANSMQIKGIPQTFLVSPQGEIKRVFTGPISTSTISEISTIIREI